MLLNIDGLTVAAAGGSLAGEGLELGESPTFINIIYKYKTNVFAIFRHSNVFSSVVWAACC